MKPEDFYEHRWILEVFAIVLITLVVNFIAVLLLKKLQKKLSKNIWLDTLIKAAVQPTGWLIWVIGIGWAASTAAENLDGDTISTVIQPIRNVLVDIIVVWFLIRFVNNMEKRILTSRSKKSRLDKTTIHALCQLVRAAVVITAILIAMQTFGVPLSGIWAFAGASGFSIGFAAKDLLQNFFGSIMVFLDRPFKVGDWIRSPEKEIEGTVEHIGWRSTQIRTFDKRPLYVPNGTFLTLPVENPSRMSNRRIRTTVGVRYEDATKIDQIVTDIEQMLQDHPEIDTRQTLFVKLIEFGPSSLNFLIYTFTKTTDWVKFQDIQQDVFLKVIEIITSHGAECAFPTTTVHLQQAVQ